MLGDPASPDGATGGGPDGCPVLFVSSNGAGMGHLTRLMAMARRRGDLVRPLFASMSQAVPVVGDEGFSWEYIPSRGDLGIGPRRWNVLLERRMTALLARERPQALIFDGTFPYDGVLDAAATVGGIRLIWSRRGMWRPALGSRQLRRSDRFDLIVEPGELAGSADRGATATRADALRVGPVTLLDADEQSTREEAAAVLGVDPDRPTALLTLGAGNINDISSDLGLLVSRLLDVPDLQVVLTRPMIADDLARFGDRVRGVSVYPVSRYFRAVDLAVAASGYNAFHELVQFGVPTAFVPNTSTAMDDQEGRARWAEEAGVGLCLPQVTPPQVDRVVSALADPVRRADLAAACRDHARPNGAGQAMAAVEALLGPAAVEGSRR
ncbi:MAG TPA: glycosyltransferase [Kineosporiaceae bacterium]|nr:glycosyltransferase [Kineosporiaceae bacterium]